MNVIGVTRDHWNHNYLVRPIGHIHSHCSFCLYVAQLTITCTKYGQLIIWTIIKRYWQQMSAFNVKDTKFHIRPRPGRGELTELQCFLQTALLDFRGPTSILESLLVSFPQILVPATINFEITFDLIVCTRTSVAIEHVPDWRWERGVCLYVGCFHVPKPIIQTWKLTTKTANKTTYADHTTVLSNQQHW